MNTFFVSLREKFLNDEKRPIIMIGLVGALIAMVIFALVAMVPHAAQDKPANGLTASDTSAFDPDLRYDYTMLDAPPSQSTVSEVVTTSSESMPSTTQVPVTVKYEDSFENNPEDAGGGNAGAGDAGGNSGGVIEPPPSLPPPQPLPPLVVDTSDFHYYATEGKNGMYDAGGVPFYLKGGNTLSSGIYSIDGLRHRINSYGALSSKMGIDVSEHNQIVNWPVAKAAGVEYAILRVGYRGYSKGGLFKDAFVDRNIKSAIANGVKVGVYFFSQAMNAGEGREEALFCLQYLRENNIRPQYPIYIDSEKSNPDNDGRADGINKADRTAAVKAFCDTVRGGGYTPGIYASASWFSDKLNFSQLRNNQIWVAHYTSATAPSFQHNWQMWQYSESLVIPNIQSSPTLRTVDINISTYDYTKGNDMSQLGKDIILVKTKAEADVYNDAQYWVNTAEKSFLQADFDTAKAKVNQLLDLRVKTSLLERLNKIQGSVVQPSTAPFVSTSN